MTKEKKKPAKTEEKELEPHCNETGSEACILEDWFREGCPILKPRKKDGYFEGAE